MNTKSLLTRIGVPVLSLGLLGGLGATLATSASAAVKPVTVTANTHLNNHPDTTEARAVPPPSTRTPASGPTTTLTEKFTATQQTMAPGWSCGLLRQLPRLRRPADGQVPRSTAPARSRGPSPSPSLPAIRRTRPTWRASPRRTPPSPATSRRCSARPAVRDRRRRHVHLQLPERELRPGPARSAGPLQGHRRRERSLTEEGTPGAGRPGRPAPSCPGAGHPREPLPPMRLRVPGPPGCPACGRPNPSAWPGQQEGEDRPADADLIGMRPAGALAGMPTASPASRRSQSRRIARLARSAMPVGQKSAWPVSCCNAPAPVAGQDDQPRRSACSI